MHDFGANRVGGLPWSLYLAAGLKLREQIQARLSAQDEDGDGDFDLVSKRSVFDRRLLRAIQERLFECQDKGLTAQRARACIDWLRQTRQGLLARSESLHDGTSWLIVAEAIMQSSLCRPESRGFFIRLDYPTRNEHLDQLYSCSWYDPQTDRVHAQLIPWSDIESRIRKG